MSDQLKRSLQDNRPEPDKPRVWSLSRTDWKRLEGHLQAAEVISQRAKEVTPEQWAEWTSEFSEGQGFPSIIYHDRPLIIHPLTIDR